MVIIHASVDCLCTLDSLLIYVLESLMVVMTCLCFGWMSFALGVHEGVFVNFVIMLLYGILCIAHDYVLTHFILISVFW